MTLDAASALGLIADRVRLRVVAALVLGATGIEEVAKAANLSTEAVQRAVDRLEARGLVEVIPPPRSYRLRDEVLRDLARQGAVPRPVPEYDPSLPEEQRKALRSFMPEGRLVSMPVARSKRVAVLDYISLRFDPGRTYPEREVNAMLGEVYDDVAMLRRMLVDEEFLERRDGFYWRAGGTFDVG